ncbi:MAG: TldD/PmbA family protein [Clostridia bacterium]|nr:TldD/PmbA family protein [Clostridia bacterium]
MEYRQFIEALFQRAKAAGFTDCEAYYSAGESFSVKVFKGEILKYSASDELGLGFRGLYNGKMGYASTQILDEEAIDLLVEGAKSNAELIENDDPQPLYPGDSEYAKVDPWSDALNEITPAQKIELAKRLEALTLAQDERIDQLESCQVFSSVGETAIVNTLGLNVHSRGNVLGGFTMPTAKDGDQTGSGWSMFAAQQPEEINLESTAKEAADRAIASMLGESVPSGVSRVVLAPEAAADLLETFCGVFSADAAQRGLSLLNGREGEQIAASCVTLIDDPHRAGSVSSSAFDGEGVATKRHSVINSGKLTTLLYNLKTAAKQGVLSTGNATRSYNSSVGIAPFNFYFAPSALSEDALLAQLGDGLRITEVQGLHAGANPISGDFSLSAKGFQVVGGKQAQPVKQITIAGNFYQLLKDIEAVGGDLKFGMPGGSCFGSPSLLVSKLSIAGK